jgi:hypothetical protein
VKWLGVSLDGPDGDNDGSSDGTRCDALRLACQAHSLFVWFSPSSTRALRLVLSVPLLPPTLRTWRDGREDSASMTCNVVSRVVSGSRHLTWTQTSGCALADPCLRTRLRECVCASVRSSVSYFFFFLNFVLGLFESRHVDVCVSVRLSVRSCCVTTSVLVCVAQVFRVSGWSRHLPSGPRGWRHADAFYRR